MNVQQIVDAVSVVVREHHDLFAAEVSKTLIPGLGMDPLAAGILMGAVMATASPGDVAKMRKWSLDDWAPALQQAIELRAQDVPPPQKQGQGAPYADVSIAAPAVPPPRKPPTPPNPPAAPPPGGPPRPPSWMTESESVAWHQARTRAGEFARGLGNYIDQRTGNIIYEVWDKDKILVDVDPAKRQAALDIIRQKVVEAQEQGKSAKMLAGELAKATKDWGRNWLRIARTELQGAYNEGVLMEHVRWDGPSARIGRVPESSACPDCKTHFLDDSGVPRIFTAQELVNNGVNVGKPRRDWKPTVWPMHPNCRCDTQAVPAGMVFGDDWNLKYEE